MSFCRNCGARIYDDDIECPYCGSVVIKEKTFEQEKDVFGEAKNSKTNINSDAKGLGIISIVSSLFSPLLGFIFGGIGRKKAKEASDNDALRLCNTGLVVAAISFVINFIYIMYL